MTEVVDRATSSELYQGFGLLCIAIAPILSASPPWAVISVAILLCWRVWIERAGKSIPPQWIRVALGLLCFALVYVSYRTLNGLEAATPLLLVMMGLKIVETESKRDLMVLMLLSMFGLATSLLHSQGILISAYMTLVAPLLLAQLVTLSHPSKQLPPRQSLGIALKLLIQAVPFAVALFFLFPRLDGPLWGTGQQGKATTGMPQQLSMGDITELTQSPNVAFRAVFHGDNPSLNDLYWRVAVMSEFDGKTWSPGPIPELKNRSFESGSRSLSYTLTLEPQHNKYLPVLEHYSPDQSVVLTGSVATLNGNWQLISDNGISERQRYSATASPDGKFQLSLDRLERRRSLVYNKSRNPRSVEWAAELKTRFPDPLERAGFLLSHFADQPYFYSLRPPKLGNDPVDEFLFDSRKGFCEHYASSFTLLMRASGVPARVVIGYQGGEYNADGGYWIVRQLDAHAWAEIWIESRGWVRVDPTFAVAPERVEFGVAASVPEADLLPAVAARRDSLFRSMRMKWDSLENDWNQLVLGYGEKQQREFLESILPSLGKAENMILLLTVIISGGTLTLVLWLAWKNRPIPLSATERSYRAYIRWLAKHGLVVSSSDGPRAVADKVTARWPDLQKAADDIAAFYIDVRYRQSADDASSEIRQTLKQLRRHKPRG